MGRRYAYFCDECKRDFGDKSHLNIKTFNTSSPLFISFYDSKLKDWKQRPVTFPSGNSESHFCDINCLKSYVEKRVKLILEQIKKGA